MPADSKIFNKLIHKRWEISHVKLAQINFSSAHRQAVDDRRAF